MKKTLGNILIILLVVFITMNALFPNAVYASNPPDSTYDPLKEWGGGILDGLLGIVLYPLKLLLLLPGVLINLALTSIAGMGGELTTVTLKNIFFNELNITNINVFDIEGATGAIKTIRSSIAGFYVALRNLAIVLSLAVLIYIGIQMARSNIAEDRAKYKQMLVNWLIGFGLIFILHYIIIITINANEMLVANLQASNQKTDYMGQLLKQAWWIPFTTSFASIIMYVVLLISTFIFLIIYIRRMLTISFLIIVAPLISVTYAIDKIDNNRSEILNTWLKEFMYNILIQPFHCIIYSVFIGIALDLISENWYKGSLDFGAMIFAVILTFSIFLGQKIVKEIFGLSQSTSLLKKVAIFAMAKTAVNNVKNIVAIKGAKNELTAQKRMNKLPNNMPDGNETNLENMVQMRQLAQEKLDSEKGNETSQATQQVNQAPKPKQTNMQAKTKKRRVLKNAPKPIRKAAGWYTDTLATASGYNFIKGVSENIKANRAYSMTDEDYFIAGSESFRQAVNPEMSNEQLSKEMERIYNETDINNLNGPAEVNYKLLIESMKKSYNKTGKDAYGIMNQSILYGSSNNKVWRK